MSLTIATVCETLFTVLNRYYLCLNDLILLKESSTNSKILAASPKNGFIFSTPQPKSQRFSVKESLKAADNEVNICFSIFGVVNDAIFSPYNPAFIMC